jgi:hypothetical protein
MLNEISYMLTEHNVEYQKSGVRSSHPACTLCYLARVVTSVGLCPRSHLYKCGNHELFVYVSIILKVYSVHVQNTVY